MLRVEGRWIWDSWPVDDGPDHHLFFLQATTSDDPDDRHWRAGVGHAVSTDYQNWTVLPDVLGAAEGPAWDDLAIWTGSVVRGDSGVWHFFYSALSRREQGRVQRIGRADSDDLITWRRAGPEPVAQADPRWYETFRPGGGREEAWRDPWVLRDPGGDGWHMLITARLRSGSPFDGGVIGHARSADLLAWEVQPPLTESAGFYHLEVPQVSEVGGRPVLLFCCREKELDESRRRRTPSTGMWSAAAASPLGPFDIAAAAPFEDPNIYAAHLIQQDDGRPALLGFQDMDGDRFAGVIPAPTPVRMTDAGVITVDRAVRPVAAAATID